MSRPPVSVALPLVAVGGALGACARYGITELWPAGGGFPWATFAINVVGCAFLASLPLLPVVRRSDRLPLFLGTGVLGGFTTMSAASEQTVALVDRGATGTAAAYCLGTPAAALLVVAVIAPAANRAWLHAEEADG